MAVLLYISSIPIFYMKAIFVSTNIGIDKYNTKEHIKFHVLLCVILFDLLISQSCYSNYSIDFGFLGVS